MEKKIGFIGCGNMGKAILGGLIASGQVVREVQRVRAWDDGHQCTCGFRMPKNSSFKH